MPRRNATRPNTNGAFYHMYNRGVNKAIIFHDALDFSYFQRLLQFYLSPSRQEAQSLFHSRPWRHQDNDLSTCVQLVSYCFMTNHFHLMLRQLTDDGVSMLMKRLSASYARYFNARYERTGHVFESSCKGRIIIDDDDFISTNAYIHRNAKAIMTEYQHYPFSNLRDILTSTEPSWWSAGQLLEAFEGSPSDYLAFVKHKEEGASFPVLTL
jgi:REP element-mobilizing transposase RayT